MRTQDRLLDAHVAFVVRELTGATFAGLVRSEVDWVLDRADEIALEDVVHRASVTAVAVKYATRVNLAAAIPEIVGEITPRLRDHPINTMRLDEIVPRARAEEFAAKIAELQPLRRKIAALVAESPVVQSWLADYVRSIALWPVTTNRRLAGRVPGVNRALAVGERLAGSVIGEADQRSRELSESAAAALLQQWSGGLADGVSDADFAEALLTGWDQVAARPVRDLLDAGDDSDLVDLVVLVFETWLDLRDGPYVPALIETGVDYFFDTYGGYPLSELMTEFGIERSDLIEEALRFAPRVVSVLAANGDLEAFVRRQLQRFYDSSEAQAALAEP